jgi:dTDP-L-rhamnose 4-epimerase
MAERILVTGGAGFVGSHVVDRVLRAGYECRVLDSLHPQVHPSGTWPGYLSPECERVHADVRDRDAVERAVAEVDVVVHLAARVGVGQSQYQIEDYIDANVRGTAALLDVLARGRHRVRKVLVAGSMSSYGEGRYHCDACGADPVGVTRSAEQLARGEWEPRCPACSAALRALPTAEDSPLQATSIYAQTKKWQEEMALLFGRVYRVPVVVLRFFNIYGPRQALSNPYTGVAAIFLARVKNGHPPVVYEDGGQQRDFVSVHDVAAANLAAIPGDQAAGLVLNVGSGRAVTVLEIARLAARQLGCDLEPEITHRCRSGDIRHCFADVSQLDRVLGFRAQIPFAAGFAELSAWAASTEAQDSFARAETELRQRGLS